MRDKKTRFPHQKNAGRPGGRLLAALLAAILMLSCFSGCGKQEPDAKAASSQPAITGEALPSSDAAQSEAQTELRETEPSTENRTETPVETSAVPATEAHTEEPTAAATEAPTEEPTEAPTEEPTEAPTEEPTEAPTEEPTEAPTEEPTEAPTEPQTEPPETEPSVVINPNQELSTEDEVLSLLSLRRRGGSTQIQFHCSDTLFSSLKEHSFSRLEMLLIKSGLSATIYYNSTDRIIQLRNCTAIDDLWVECASTEEVRQAILRYAADKPEKLLLLCPPSLADSLWNEYELDNYTAQAGFKADIRIDTYSGVIQMKKFTPVQSAWAVVDNQEQFFEAIRSFSEQGLDSFDIVFQYAYYLELKADDENFRLLFFSSKLDSYNYNRSSRGVISFSQVTYTEEPKLVCRTEDDIISGIRQMGAEGIDAFRMYLADGLSDSLQKDLKKPLHKLEGEAGMITADSYISRGILRYSNARIVTDPDHVSTPEEAISLVDRKVRDRAEEIVLFCTPELYNSLIQNLDNGWNVFGPSGMERIYDLICQAGIYNADLSAFRDTGAICIGVKTLYPGTEILLAVDAGTTGSLSPRLQETLESARALADQCRASTPLETARNLHDALCERITYTIDDKTDEDDTAIGALLSGQADCDGYSDAFVLVGRLAGLNVRYQHGKSTAPTYSLGSTPTHMWTLLELDGSWRMVDVTWDDSGEETGYLWFNIGMDRASRTHKWNEDMTVPLLEQTDLNARPESEHSVASEAEVREVLETAIANGNKRIVLVYDDADYEDHSHVRSIIREFTRESYEQSWNSEMRAFTIIFE